MDLPRTLASVSLMTLCGLLLAGSAAAQENEVGTDIGTFYKDEIAPLYKKPGYSPYAGRNYPTRVLVGRHAPSHRQLARRRRLRQHARAGGGLSVRARRGGDLVDGPTGEAQPTARFPGGRRPRRGARRDRRAEERQSAPNGRSDAAALARHDGERPGCRRRDRDHQLGRHRHDAEGDVQSRSSRSRSGRPTRQPPSATTSLAASRP